MIRTDKKPHDHFVGPWIRGRMYPLYSLVSNNRSIFRSLTHKKKPEPYVLYDNENDRFYANDGWQLVYLSEDSRISALGGNGGGSSPAPSLDSVQKIHSGVSSLDDIENPGEGDIAIVSYPWENVDAEETINKGNFFKIEVNPNYTPSGEGDLFVQNNDTYDRYPISQLPIQGKADDNISFSVYRLVIVQHQEWYWYDESSEYAIDENIGNEEYGYWDGWSEESTYPEPNAVIIQQKKETERFEYSDGWKPYDGIQRVYREIDGFTFSDLNEGDIFEKQVIPAKFSEQAGFLYFDEDGREYTAFHNEESVFSGDFVIKFTDFDYGSISVSKKVGDEWVDVFSLEYGFSEDGSGDGYYLNDYVRDIQQYYRADELDINEYHVDYEEYFGDASKLKVTGNNIYHDNVYDGNFAYLPDPSAAYGVYYEKVNTGLYLRGQVEWESVLHRPIGVITSNDDAPDYSEPDGSIRLKDDDLVDAFLVGVSYRSGDHSDGLCIKLKDDEANAPVIRIGTAIEDQESEDGWSFGSLLLTGAYYMDVLVDGMYLEGFYWTDGDGHVIYPEIRNHGDFFTWGQLGIDDATQIFVDVQDTDSYEIVSIVANGGKIERFGDDWYPRIPYEGTSPGIISHSVSHQTTIPFCGV